MLYSMICAVVDVCVFFLVDSALKPILTPMNSNSESGLCLCESLVLLVVTILLGLLHHWSSILLFLAAVILAWGIVGDAVRRWVGQLHSRWNDFKEYEQSFEASKNWRASQAPMPDPNQPPNFSVDNNGTWVQNPGQTAPAPGMESCPNPGATGDATAPHSAQLRPPPTPGSPMYAPPRPTPMNPHLHNGSMSSPGQRKLKEWLAFGGRRLSGFLPFQTGRSLASRQKASLVESSMHFLSSCGAMVQSLFEATRLINTGEDSDRDFIRNTFQLLDAFRWNSEHIPGLQETLMKALTKPGNPDAVRRDTDCDMAEFIAAFVAVLQANMRKCGVCVLGASVPDKVCSSQARRYRHMHLTYVYGHLTPDLMRELLQQCQSEIEKANPLDSRTYAESVQRLCDLHWLLHKEHHNSTVDELLTGQLVDSSHCLSCLHMSVDTQPFTVLSLPVAEPVRLCNAVHLHDCFVLLTSAEDLVGARGRRCERCCRLRERQDLARVNGDRTLCSPNADVTGPRASTPCKMNSSIVQNMGSYLSTILSPIKMSAARDDSVCNDQIGKAPNFAPNARFSDCQRRTLLNQLPECLIVQLQRFNSSKDQMKNCSPVHIPLLNLDLTPYVLDHVLQRDDLTMPVSSYNLRGLAVHVEGNSPATGRYITYTSSGLHTWVKRDNSKVSHVNMMYELNTTMVQQNAHLLFYQRNPMIVS